MVGSVANFDRTCPAEKIQEVKKREELTENEIKDEVKKVEVDWEDKLKTMLYL